MYSYWDLECCKITMQSSGSKPTAVQFTAKKLKTTIALQVVEYLHKVLESIAAVFVVMQKVKIKSIQKKGVSCSRQKKPQKTHKTTHQQNSVEVYWSQRLRILLLTKGKSVIFGSKIRKLSLPHCVLQNLKTWTLRKLFKHPSSDNRESE